MKTLSFAEVLKRQQADWAREQQQQETTAVDAAVRAAFGLDIHQWVAKPDDERTALRRSLLNSIADVLGATVFYGDEAESTAGQGQSAAFTEGDGDNANDEGDASKDSSDLSNLTKAQLKALAAQDFGLALENALSKAEMIDKINEAKAAAEAA